MDNYEKFLTSIIADPLTELLTEVAEQLEIKHAGGHTNLRIMLSFYVHGPTEFMKLKKIPLSVILIKNVYQKINLITIQTEIFFATTSYNMSLKPCKWRQRVLPKRGLSASETVPQHSNHNL
jgi:hypothetical protein